jgi:hypothetical protein
MQSPKTSAVILSTGRTGTMFIAQTLQAFAPEAEVFHEAGERSRLINILSHAHLSGFIPITIPLRMWSMVIGADLIACQKEYYIDSNNHIYALVSLKPDIYPGLKVIHIVRDPRTYVRSHINWSRHRLKSYIANYLTPFWQPNGFMVGEISFFQWRRLSRFQRFCWIWDFKNRMIEKITINNIPYLRIRFEDIFLGSNPETHLNKILDFIGMPHVIYENHWFSKPINPGVKSSFPTWQSWTRQMCNQLVDLCGDTMNRYGYGDELEWLEKIDVA